MIERVCNACGMKCVDGKVDPCLGTLPGVSAACCGHGGEAYVMFEGGKVLRGKFDHTTRIGDIEPGKTPVREGAPRRDWEDVGFTVLAAVGDYVVEFSIYDVHEPGEPINDDARVVLHGHVKWDGCSNWMTPSGNYDIHCCEREHLTNIGEALARCWDWTAELLPTFNP